MKWLEDVGIPTLKTEIKEFEKEGFAVGLIITCEMIYHGNIFGYEIYRQTYRNSLKLHRTIREKEEEIRKLKERLTE